MAPEVAFGVPRCRRRRVRVYACIVCVCVRLYELKLMPTCRRRCLFYVFGAVRIRTRIRCDVPTRLQFTLWSRKRCTFLPTYAFLMYYHSRVCRIATVFESLEVL